LSMPTTNRLANASRRASGERGYVVVSIWGSTLRFGEMRPKLVCRRAASFGALRLKTIPGHLSLKTCLSHFRIGNCCLSKMVRSTPYFASPALRTITPSRGFRLVVFQASPRRPSARRRCAKWDAILSQFSLHRLCCEICLNEEHQKRSRSN